MCAKGIGRQAVHIHPCTGHCLHVMLCNPFTTTCNVSHVVHLSSARLQHEVYGGANCGRTFGRCGFPHQGTKCIPMQHKHGLSVPLCTRHATIHTAVTRGLLPNMRGWPRMSALVLVGDMALGCLAQHKDDMNNFNAMCELRGAVARVLAQTNRTLQEPTMF